MVMRVAETKDFLWNAGGEIWFHLWYYNASDSLNAGICVRLSVCLQSLSEVMSLAKQEDLWVPSNISLVQI